MESTEENARRAQILDAAARVISVEGVDSARMADIAEDAGVSLGLVQHYFRHRHRLLTEVFRRESERIAVTWRTVVDPEAPPLDRLAEYLRLCTPAGSASAARSFGPGWGFWLELWSKAHRDPAIQAEVPGIYESFAEPFANAIERGIADRTFVPPSPVADIVDRLVSLIDGAAVRTRLGALPGDRMLSLLIDALALELRLDPEQTAYVHARAAREPESVA